MDVETTAEIPTTIDGYLNSTNSTEPDINSYYFYATEQLAVLWTLFLLIVAGNSAVLLALAFNKNRKSRMNYFIMQLAVADLSVGLISVLTDIVWRITITWHAGNLACKIIRYLQAVVTYSSTYVLVALSIDRYDAIKHPMRFSGSWRRAKVLVVVAWLLSGLFSLPIIILYQEKTIEGQSQCWIDFDEPWQWQLYMSLVSVALFVIPALVITACYAVIVSTIWRKGSHVILVTNNRKNNKGPENKLRYEHDPECRRASSRGLIPRAKVKTIKMTFVIVFVFILCWSPYIVFDLLQVYGYVPRTQTNLAVATFIQSLAPLNSAANPVIYCLFSTRICRTLRKLPAVSWLCRVLGLCWPGGTRASMRGGSSRSTFRYNGASGTGHNTDFSSTLTSSMTAVHSSRRGTVTRQSPRTASRNSGSLVTVV